MSAPEYRPPRSPSAGASFRPTTGTAAKIRPPRSQGARPRRRRTELPPHRPAAGFEQEYSGRNRETITRHSARRHHDLIRPFSVCPLAYISARSMSRPCTVQNSTWSSGSGFICGSASSACASSTTIWSLSRLAAMPGVGSSPKRGRIRSLCNQSWIKKSLHKLTGMNGSRLSENRRVAPLRPVPPHGG